jgi:primosomal protein N' (replication factor Y)
VKRSILEVAVDVPLPTVYDYLVETEEPPAPGVRVAVPFGNGRRCGVVVGHRVAAAVAGAKLRGVETILDERPLFDAEHLAFLRWAADYYHHPLGEVLGAALPVRLRRGEAALPLGEAGWRLTAAGASVDPAHQRRAPRQAAVLAQLREHLGALGHGTLTELLGACTPTLRALRAKGWVEPCRVKDPPPGVALPEEAGPELTGEQRRAVAAMMPAVAGFAAFLLEGVTGSGKTEVYLRLARAVLVQGRSVLVLVPEIALTPQLVRRFTRRLGDCVAVLHSGLADREREVAWQKARLGAARLVIGTRSAVLGPLANLGLVIVDEEHDPSFKQQDGFRYSARDLAVVRARRARGGRGCPVVLGSATPSLESLHNAGAGRFVHLQLHRRPGAVMPTLALLDIRDQPLEGGMSRVLLQALEQTLAAGDQGLVFLNRRGFAPVLACYDCGWLSDCPRCDARQTLHATSGLLWCHHCGAQRRAPVRCPQCGAHDLHPLGQGTQRLEETLAGRFPGVPLIRIDRDATRRKGSLERLLNVARAGNAALLVGTQMLAKGHHLPRVTLVGVVDVDGGLFGADFRAAERMAQLLIQVAGRAGRGDATGRVLIQTRYPDHPLLRTLVQGGYPAFAAAALAERAAAQLPPFAFQALFRAEATKPDDPRAFLEGVAALTIELRVPEVEAWGPVPAPMERKAGRYRAHLLLQSRGRPPLHSLLRRLLPAVRALAGSRRVRWSLDVDPVELL